MLGAGDLLLGGGDEKGAYKQADLNKGTYHPVYKLLTKSPVGSTHESRVQKGLEEEQWRLSKTRAYNKGSILGVYNYGVPIVNGN